MLLLLVGWSWLCETCLMAGFRVRLGFGSVGVGLVLLAGSVLLLYSDSAVAVVNDSADGDVWTDWDLLFSPGDIEVSPDGSEVYVVHADLLLADPQVSPPISTMQRIVVLDQSGRELRRIGPTTPVDLGVAPDGGIYAASGGALYLFTPDGSVADMWDLPSTYSTFAVSPLGAVYVAQDDGVSMLTDDGTFELAIPIPGLGDRKPRLAFNLTGDLVLAAMDAAGLWYDWSVSVFADHIAVSTVALDGDQPLTDLVVGSDGRYIAVSQGRKGSGRELVFGDLVMYRTDGSMVRLLAVFGWDHQAMGIAVDHCGSIYTSVAHQHRRKLPPEFTDSVHKVVLTERLAPCFVDVGSSIFTPEINWLAQEHITMGCNPPVNDQFCPASSVTRGQMAAFLVRALDLTDSLPDPFTDDDDSIFEADIEKLAAAGITKGCNPPTNDRFCPDSKVTREQMAAFLVRALGYADDGGGNLFIDDDESIFEGDIDKLGTAGVTKGCNPPTNNLYCPDSVVTRGQMAAFLHRALG
jgi:DNA-binding beta-propeller fold protein YncE